jgi:hypothetical protein
VTPQLGEDFTPIRILMAIAQAVLLVVLTCLAVRRPAGMATAGSPRAAVAKES